MENLIYYILLNRVPNLSLIENCDSIYNFSADL